MRAIATTSALLMLLLAGCERPLECGPGTEQVGHLCVPDPTFDSDDDDSADDDDAAPDDDDAAPDDDDAAPDDDDAAPDDDDAAPDDDDTTPDETFQVGLCNDLKGLEDIVELYMAVTGEPEQDELLGSGVIEWYACAFVILGPGTYDFRVVDEAGFQYAVTGLWVDAYFEYWFDYGDQI